MFQSRLFARDSEKGRIPRELKDRTRGARMLIFTRSPVLENPKGRDSVVNFRVSVFRGWWAGLVFGWQRGSVGPYLGPDEVAERLEHASLHKRRTTFEAGRNWNGS